LSVIHIIQWLPTGGNFFPGESLVLQGEIMVVLEIAFNIALIIIHVCLIFLNNSWNHSTDKSKSVFRFIAILLSLDKIWSNSYEIDIFLILSIYLTASCVKTSARKHTKMQCFSKVLQDSCPVCCSTQCFPLSSCSYPSPVVNLSHGVFHSRLKYLTFFFKSFPL